MVVGALKPDQGSNWQNYTFLFCSTAVHVSTALAAGLPAPNLAYFTTCQKTSIAPANLRPNCLVLQLSGLPGCYFAGYILIFA